MSTTDEELATLFGKVGFDEAKSKEILKNKKVSLSLAQIIEEVEADEPLSKSKTALLHNLATLVKGENLPKRELITRAIADERLTTNLQVSEAYKYVKEAKESSTEEGMNVRSGVGIVITREQVDEEVAKYINDHKQEIETKRYSCVPALLGNIKALPQLKWASPALFKPIIDEQVLKLLGPKDERDVVKKEKKKKAKQPETATKQSAVTGDVKQRSMFSEGFLGDLHKPGENPQMWPELMKEHLKVTGGRVFTRFPPEPNGYLHIGHSKAIMVNFGYAKYHDGVCYLRYDDTNPEAEEEKYFVSIKTMVEWLGFKPWKITYSSDYFDQLYELGEKLIQVGKGYVCHCTAQEVKLQRGMKEDGTPGGKRFACPHRERPVEESLQEFRNMRDGKYQSGEATLRMKQDLESPSPQMWDLVAYRVLNAPHHRTGDKWKIYPTYDFTHCLVDSFENISHSLCTTEFQLSRESYEWLCDVLHVYRPAQREYGRLNITGTILSKRKIAKLVNEGIVRGWDDPRLFTLEGIKRRGVPPGAILSFINTLGVTTSTTNIQATRFESAVRSYLDVTTPRLMMILDPVLCVIDNVDDTFEEKITIPYKPGDAKLGDRSLTFTKEFYIDRSDYRDETSKDYFRLAPGQPVGLMKVPFTVSVSSVERDDHGKVTTIHVNYDKVEGKPKKPKTYIQWIPKSTKQNSPVHIKETRIHNVLFNSENPSSHPDGFTSDINKDSEEVITTAIIEPAFFDIKSRSPLNLPTVNEEFNIKEQPNTPESIRYQALRVGYFCVDKDTNGDQEIILNRIVTLKEDSSKD
ncbi:Glutamine--tRNA ligase [Komagataella phaffii CBS 7435]|uniref:glutamine--tRNA ligase n=2 Tax=Komagataella phaffii TaxID=460519 RepID=C4R439_KOMPG|nr:Glutamine tRNA synthetase [Komagataella phaffii GS115]AOA63182.1 GQ67_03341T0 [Komagataella phaffii]CAH2449931.1 Glutamine--tRNA ligase [Komagataella phaffii CBS 7435]AOA69016.1 GQ68_03310T0 [Komagataella phaffii GS115]CAY70325.1 Glutamine tRNA synthetase [Komagataella phaffii GS115]CCA39883.1 Glutamine--tRNA ligase [Komagataella phaffii CBS 7435]